MQLTILLSWVRAKFTLFPEVNRRAGEPPSSSEWTTVTASDCLPPAVHHRGDQISSLGDLLHSVAFELRNEHVAVAIAGQATWV